MAYSRYSIRRRDQAGFTLIELLVALSVTVIGLIGLLSLHVSTMKGNRSASRSAEATAIGQQTVEELRGLPVNGVIDSIVSRHGPLPIVDAVLDPVDGRAGMIYSRTLDVTPIPDTDMVLMRVEVTWADDGADPATAPVELVHTSSFELARSTLEAL